MSSIGNTTPTSKGSEREKELLDALFDLLRGQGIMKIISLALFKTSVANQLDLLHILAKLLINNPKNQNEFR